jgi:N-sulfoglucosamine sulfohydrolase
VADRAANFFSHAKEESKPFFLTAGFIDPHRDLTRGGFGNQDVFDPRVKRTAYDTDDVVVPDWLNDLPGVRRELANYYESISRLDQGVGMILDSLEQANLLDETLIIFLSDNGPPFINSKTTLFDAGVNLPLIIRSPGSGKGILNPNFVSYVDILPTIMEFAGLPVDSGNETSSPSRAGRSFAQILAETEELPDWDDVYGSHTFHEVTNYWPTRYIRNRRYKYHRNIAWRLDFPMAADLYGSLTWDDIRDMDKNSDMLIGSRPLKDYFFRPAEELYDLDNDPQEVRNVAKDDAYAEILAD